MPGTITIANLRLNRTSGVCTKTPSWKPAKFKAIPVMRAEAATPHFLGESQAGAEKTFPPKTGPVLIQVANVGHYGIGKNFKRRQRPYHQELKRQYEYGI